MSLKNIDWKKLIILLKNFINLFKFKKMKKTDYLILMQKKLNKEENTYLNVNLNKEENYSIKNKKI